jgi:DNA-binding transcriptional LysR family regulator
MELGHLRALVEAAQRGSFSHAAQALVLTQPALSARIHSLERELGVPLFHRMGRGVRLTEAGKALLPFAERALEAVRQGQESLSTGPQADSGRLQVGTARVIGTYVLPDLLKRFGEEHPGIAVHIRTGRSSDVLRMVVNEEVQVGLARDLRHPEVLTAHLYDEEIVLVTHPSHPFALRGEASIYDVAKEPLILYDRDSSYFVLIDRVCREAGVVPNVEMNLDSIEATKQMIERGLGISFLPLHGINRELELGTLALIRIREGSGVALGTSVMVRRARAHSPAVLAFLGVLARAFETQIPVLDSHGLQSAIT